jgi:hypothetical protein
MDLSVACERYSHCDHDAHRRQRSERILDLVPPQPVVAGGIVANIGRYVSDCDVDDALRSLVFATRSRFFTQRHEIQLKARFFETDR